MADKQKNYYVSVQGLDKSIKISEKDYNQIFENMTLNLKVVEVRSLENPEKRYVIIIDRINYFVKEEVKDNKELTDQPSVITFI